MAESRSERSSLVEVVDLADLELVVQLPDAIERRSAEAPREERDA